MKTVLGLTVIAVLACSMQAQQDGAVYLNGVDAKGSVRMGSFSSQNTTWEAWVRLPAYNAGLKTASGPVLFRWGGYSHGAPRVHHADGTASAGPLHGAVDVRSAPGTLVPGHWHHVASVFDGNNLPGVSLYVDGQVVGHAPAGSLVRYGSTFELVLGAVGYAGYSNFLNAELDEVRLSSVQRYTASFTPKKRFQSDPSTMGLWHFDSLAGGVAKDASPNGRHFRLSGGYRSVAGVNATKATYVLTGVGCPGAAAPVLTHTGLPALGKQMIIKGNNLAAFDLSALAFGFDKTIAGLPLPLSLASIGLPNCELYSSGNVMIGPFLGDQWQFAFTIPSSAAHVGLQFSNQIWVYAPQMKVSGAGVGVVGW